MGKLFVPIPLIPVTLLLITVTYIIIQDWSLWWVDNRDGKVNGVALPDE
jgi:hypothetical protein